MRMQHFLIVSIHCDKGVTLENNPKNERFSFSLTRLASQFHLELLSYLSGSDLFQY